MIDLRSDTVTRPGDGMRAAMATAEVGDDVFSEDPTVARLQETIADRLNKEAALFVPSGSMCNQIALRVHANPGDEVLLDAGSHIANYESGAAAALSGIQLKQIPSDNGFPEVHEFRDMIRSGYYWEPQPRLICLENTHNRAGGLICPLGRIEGVAEVAKDAGLAMHLDGARLWNASVATGISESAYAEHFDSVSVCLSKGLGAPIGSVLAGSSEFITRAHRFRKMFGGGMRQVGILAAAGLYALENNYDDLSVDHKNAAELAAVIASLAPFTLSPGGVDTNIVIFDVTDGRSAAEILDILSTDSILMVPFGPNTIRATTHRDLSADDIRQTKIQLQELFA
jgi:threonine aldolase